jgi:tetratricopeptide (TPR) repeat protein
MRSHTRSFPPSITPVRATLAAVATFALASAPVGRAADLEKLRLRNELGMVQAKGGHLEDALRQFTLVLAEAPNEPAALNNAANVYFLEGDAGRARELYQRAIAAAPKEGGVHLNLGLLMHAGGETEEGLAHVREGLLLIGDLQHAYFLLGLSSPTPGASGAEAAAAAPAAGGATPAPDAVASTGAPSPGRAADEAGLRSVEIEALLARAIEKVPHADSTATRVAVEQGGMTTRPAGAKAAQIESSPQRLYWMPLAPRP